MGTPEPPWWAPPGLGTTHLSDLLDLAASFANEGPALAGGHHKPEGDRGPAGSRAVGHGAADVLRGRGGVEGSALLQRHALGTCLAQAQGGDAGTSGPGQGDLGAFPVPFPRTSSAAQKKTQMYFWGEQQPNSAVSMETGLGTAPRLGPTSAKQEPVLEGTQGTGGGSGTPQLQGQHGASRCTRDQGSSSGKNNPGADYSGHVLAGGGEAQGQGSTDLLKAKPQLQGRCPGRCRAVQPLEDSLHSAQTALSPAAFKAVVRAGGSGDRAASAALFLPG